LKSFSPSFIKFCIKKITYLRMISDHSDKWPDVVYVVSRRTSKSQRAAPIIGAFWGRNGLGLAQPGDAIRCD
jgi:hypothetical protein